MIARKKLQRLPTHPGEILREDFLPDFELTSAQLAAHLKVSRQTINELLRERRALSPQMAVKLGRLFGNSSQFWMNLQEHVNLWDAEHELAEELKEIQPLVDA